MRVVTRMGRKWWPELAFAGAILAGCSGSGGVPAPGPGRTPPPNPSARSVRIATDPFTNSASQHATQVEPSAFANGSTIVAAFQDGRFVSFGASDIGFASSLDGGATWNSGVLPGTTTLVAPPGSFDSVSDPSVTYDAAHAVWLVASLPILFNRAPTPAALVSRSTDAVHWFDPVAVAPGQPSTDKDWIACDNTASSPYYGRCYLETDDGNTGIIRLDVSNDGGLSWGPVQNTLGAATGIGGQPLVAPNGTVVVPIDDFNEARVLAFASHDGGATWSAATLVSSIADHLDAGSIRSNPLVSAGIDGAGTLYAVWQDCRFQSGCTENDLVLSTSSNGTVWSAPARIPIDPPGSGVDHFIPGLGVDRTSSGGGARLALTYDYYANGTCTMASCLLYAGFVESRDGGATWSAPVTLAGPMNLEWLAQTTQGSMVGDYLAAVYVAGRPIPVYTVANPPVIATLDEAIYVPQPLVIPASFGALRSSKGERAARGAVSDHGPRRVRPFLGGI
ncbi:MAG TPA: sialidase family protein [Candidatus Baltobacteraceae bacterium]